MDTVFEGQVAALGDGKVIPFVKGAAYVNGEATLIMSGKDPFKYGIS